MPDDDRSPVRGGVSARGRISGHSGVTPRRFAWRPLLAAALAGYGAPAQSCRCLRIGGAVLSCGPLLPDARVVNLHMLTRRPVRSLGPANRYNFIALADDFVRRHVYGSHSSSCRYRHALEDFLRATPSDLVVHHGDPLDVVRHQGESAAWIAGSQLCVEILDDLHRRPVARSPCFGLRDRRRHGSWSRVKASRTLCEVRSTSVPLRLLQPVAFSPSCNH